MSSALPVLQCFIKIIILHLLMHLSALPISEAAESIPVLLNRYLLIFPLFRCHHTQQPY